MECKYCKQKISIMGWLFLSGMCFHCSYKIDKEEHELNRDISNEYWRKA